MKKTKKRFIDYCDPDIVIEIMEEQMIPEKIPFKDFRRRYQEKHMKKYHTYLIVWTMKKQVKPLGADYPELEMLSKILAQTTAMEINKMVCHVKTKCPYPAQCVLEMLIKRLEDKV